MLCTQIVFKKPEPIQKDDKTNKKSICKLARLIASSTKKLTKKELDQEASWFINVTPLRDMGS